LAISILLESILLQFTSHFTGAGTSVGVLAADGRLTNDEANGFVLVIILGKDIRTTRQH